MKIKQAAVFLIASSAIWGLSEIYWITQEFTGSSWDFYKNKPVDLILSILVILVPISLLLVGISLLKSNKNVASLNTAEQTMPQEAPQNLSVGEWLVNFLITIIPIVGLVFVIVWANDNTNKIKKNWAIASLIWMGIMVVLSLLFYSIIFASVARSFRSE